MKLAVLQLPVKGATYGHSGLDPESAALPIRS